MIYWRGIKLMNLGFSQCKTNSGEKDKVSTVKSQTETHFGETYRDITGQKETRLRSETQ